MGKVVKLGWMEADVIGEDEEADRERRNGRILFFVRCRNEDQHKREN